MANQSKFTSVEKNFIVEQYLLGKTDTEVKRAFRAEFGDPFRVTKIKPTTFKSVYVTYQKEGKRGIGAVEKKCHVTRTPNFETTAKIKHLIEQKSVSTREASRILGVPQQTVHWQLKSVIGMSFYKV